MIDVQKLLKLAGEATPGGRKREALGGCSTVVLENKPARSDSRIPAFAYDETRGHCIGYPALYENDNGRTDTRLDFVCFSHGDAALIAATDAEVIKALCEVVVAAKRAVLAADGFVDDGTVATHLEFNEADNALRKSLEPFEKD